MLCDHWYDHDRVFRALALVYGDGKSVGQLAGVNPIVHHWLVIYLHGQRLIHNINADEPSNVAIERGAEIVVGCLHNAIPHTEQAPTQPPLRLLR